jgi:hypothetical protein
MSVISEYINYIDNNGNIPSPGCGTVKTEMNCIAKLIKETDAEY